MSVPTSIRDEWSAAVARGECTASLADYYAEQRHRQLELQRAVQVQATSQRVALHYKLEDFLIHRPDLREANEAAQKVG